LLPVSEVGKPMVFPGLESLFDGKRGADGGGGGVGLPQLSHVFRPTHRRLAAEAKAQKAVSAESAIRVRLPSACPGCGAWPQ
jgi:hypothetical protein